MKVKSIIICGLLLLGVGVATTSCEDMFTAENNLVSTDLAPQDTVYQIMGIVKRMQKLADRTVLLGEIRADLVEINPTVASTDLQQLYDNNIDTDNVYNKPIDYYDVINNCNIYLANVDAQLKSHGVYYYEKEICAAKCFRAWCYLELAKIYGEVPLVTEPVLTPEAAEAIVVSGEKADMRRILDFCIADLEQYPFMNVNLELRPRYGVTFWEGVPCDNFFLPVRAMLAELYLWRGSCEGPSDVAKNYYIKAIRMYHDYFCFPNEERGVQNYTVEWRDRNHSSTEFPNSDDEKRNCNYPYSDRFSVNAITDANVHYKNKTVSMENVSILPCDTVSYYGNVSDLRTVFNSQYSNNYYPWVSPSNRIRKISAAQQYCYYDTDPQNRDTVYFSLDPTEYTQSSMVGDLRFSAVYKTTNAGRQDDANLNSTRAWIIKWAGGSTSFPTTDVKNCYISLFRTPILYLHMAEALNRAGFPETAFAVLKYGLTYEVMNNRRIISQQEFDALCDIKTYGFSLTEVFYSDKENNSFVVWPSSVFYNPENRIKQVQRQSPTAQNPVIRIKQIGIHSLGSGFTELNDKYYLPTDLSGIKELPEILPEPEEAPYPNPKLSYEEWLDGKRDNATNKKRYEEYETAHADSIAKHEAYPEEYEKYLQSIKAYLDVYESNNAWLASDAVRIPRMAEVSKMILEEEALEGMFEGHRFYDLMRYQMQEGKLSGVNAVIDMPQHIREKYGDSQRDGMIGRPWYLKLPTR